MTDSRRADHLRQTAERAIRDSIARFPGARLAGYDLHDADTVHRLIQTAHLDIRLTQEP